MNSHGQCWNYSQSAFQSSLVTVFRKSESEILNAAIFTSDEKRNQVTTVTTLAQNFLD